MNLRALVPFTFVLLASCVDATSSPSLSDPLTPPAPRCADGKCDVGRDGPPGLCVAIRGNGQNIFAHFASLARIVEHYGPVEGLAGGSSGSITSFFVESMALQPAVYDCGERACDAREVADRTAFLLKSLHGYVDVLGDTDEGLALKQLGPIAARVRSEGIAALAVNDVLAARDALITLLSSAQLRDLINPELITLLLESPDPAFHVRDVVAALGATGAWKPDADALVRPGVFDFDAFADKLGRAGSFYAGYGPAEAERLRALLDDCAAPSRGLDWSQAAALPAGTGSCGEGFRAMVAAYRRAWGDGTRYRSRVDDLVGEFVPALITTSVVVGPTRASLEAAHADYRAARPYRVVPSFDDVGFGYWGHPDDLAVVAGNPRGYDDAKTARFVSLGAATWRTVLSRSPAEPGLARALPVDDQTLSAGGWADLEPTLVLENLGCEHVVLVSRQSTESAFARGVASLLGMNDEQDAALFGVGGASALQRSVDEADGVWCTNWDAYSGFPIEPIWRDAYDAPLVTDDPFFAQGDAPYPGRSSAVDLPGCSRRR